MDHIGHKIREKRQENKMSAEYVANKLKRPISKQAFAKKERNGNFSYDLVLEVASIIGCDVAIFLPERSTKSFQSKSDQGPAA